jgi:hypothetical protein
LATINGAWDMGIANSVGSLTPGKRADLILIRTTDLNMAPLGDPVTAIVRSAQPHIDGRILKRGGRLTALDAAENCDASIRVACRSPAPRKFAVRSGSFDELELNCMLFPWVDEQRPYWSNHTNMPERFRTALGPGVVSLRCNVARGYRSRSRPFASHLLRHAYPSLAQGGKDLSKSGKAADDCCH